MKRAYLISLLLISVMTLINLLLSPLAGYKAVGLIYLMMLQTASIVYKDFKIVMSSLLTSLLWNYLFIPPRFTFNIQDREDWVLMICFIVTSVIIGYFLQKIKEHQRALDEKKLLKESERIYRTLLNSVSHELKTPLAAIKGFVQFYQQKNQSADVVIGEINIATQRLEELVKNLLDMGRLESGNIKLHLELSELPEIIYSAHQKVKDKAEKRKFTFHFPQNLPMLKFDLFLIEQAFENIFRNACLYTPVDSEVISRIELTSSHLKILIEDNGEGLGADPPSVFNKFYRSVPNITGGTGLGLSIVKTIIELHRGFILAENKASGGALFTIFLPLNAEVIV